MCGGEDYYPTSQVLDRVGLAQELMIMASLRYSGEERHLLLRRTHRSSRAR